jgi:hypothetical protein
MGIDPPDGVRFPSPNVSGDSYQGVAACQADLVAERVKDLYLALAPSLGAPQLLNRDRSMRSEEYGVVLGAERADIANYGLVNLG